MILPFKKTYIYAGLGSLSGIIKFEKGVLEIEYQTIDEIIRVFKSDPKKVTLHLADIEAVEIKKGWFSYKLQLDVKTLKSLNGFPAANSNRLTTKISKSEVEKLKNLKSNLTLALSEYKLDELEIGNSDTFKPKKPDHSNQNLHLIEADTDKSDKLPNALKKQKKTE